MGFWPVVRRLAGVVLGVGLLGLVAAGPLRVIDNLVYDAVMEAKARGAPAAEPEVVIVETDDESIEELGRFPWSRARFAQLLDRLRAAGARGVLLNFLFSGPGDPAGDKALERALAKDGPVVLAAAGGVITPPGGGVRLYRIDGLREPLRAFARAAAGVGNGGLVDDRDGSFRRYVLTYARGEAPMPALALAGLRAAKVRSPFAESLAREGDGSFWIDYGLVAPDSLRRLSFIWVLRGPKADLERAARGKWVVVVANHTGTTDPSTTPLSPWTPSGYIHAYGLLNILREAPVRRLDGWPTFLLACAGTALIILARLGGRPRRWLAASVGLIGGPLLLAAGGLYFRGFFLEPALPSLSAGLTLAFLAIGQFQRVLVQEGLLRGAFRRYFGRGVGARILHAARGPSAPERRDLTILFTDIAGFTSFSDAAGPDQIMEVLKAFNDAAITAVEEHEGTIDKLIGDAVMAYWGYPLKADDHAAKAIRAALSLRRRMVAANRLLKEKGLGPFEIRTGIATGVVTVGEFGNERFASHTAIGRAVNLAERLQALASPGEILVSPSTCLQARQALPHAFSEKDPVALKGFHEPVSPFCVEAAA